LWMWRITFFNYVLAAAAFYIPFSGFYFWLDLPHKLLVACSALPPAFFLLVRLTQAQSFVDVQLSQTLGDAQRLRVFSHQVPRYRHLDVYKSAARFAAREGFDVLETQHMQGLSDILNHSFPSDFDRVVKRPKARSQPTGPDTMDFVPDDAFWIKKGTTTGVAVLRVRLEQYQGGHAQLEVALHRGSDPQSVIDAIVADSAENSVYKGQLVELSFDDGSVDEFTGVVQGHAMDMRFLPVPRISGDDIVLSDLVQQVLLRNVVEFHSNRTALRRIGLPGKRGLLFYGPPGTGKTYTTKYLARQLDGVTTIVVSGSGLAHVKAVCSAAKVLQPALVVMEDVDLVFSSRESNSLGAALGDLMDELDGFGVADEILYILTTNAIERVESAIKDRPGRISQCVYFGSPTRELRRRYLEHLLAPYENRTLGIDDLAERTDGSTQAFLKELVYRAVQVCFGRLNEAQRDGVSSEALPLSSQDFELAMKEMRSGAGAAGEAIIGFRVDGRRPSS